MPLSVTSDNTSPSFMDMLLKDIDLIDSLDQLDHVETPVAEPSVESPVPDEITLPDILPANMTPIDDVMDQLITDFDVADKDPSTRVSRAIITFHAEEADPNLLLAETWFHDTNERLAMWGGQYEIGGNTNSLHGHIYCEFERAKRVRFSELRELIVRVTGKPGDISTPKRSTKKQRQGAINYVTKEPTRVEGTTTIWPHCKYPFVHNVAMTDACMKRKQPKKEDILNYLNGKYATNPSWSFEQVLHENTESQFMLADCGYAKKFWDTFYAGEERRVIKDVILLVGAGGTGKTTYALEYSSDEISDKGARYWKRSFGHSSWGSGRTAYKGQAIIHFDEYQGQERLSDFKEFADIGKEGPAVDIKHSSGVLNHHTLIVSSNYHPGSWYRNVFRDDPKQFHPFWRRVTKVLFFPAEISDGVINDPTSKDQVGIYYEDHTQMWKDMKGDYQACVEHAEKYWPFKEEAVSNGEDLWIPEAKRQRR